MRQRVRDGHSDELGIEIDHKNILSLRYSSGKWFHWVMKLDGVLNKKIGYKNKWTFFTIHFEFEIVSNHGDT